MKSLFRYPGGKAKLREKIIRYAPRYYAEYREPFVGGGHVFFGINPSKRRWINDKDEALMSVYLALRDRPRAFIRACQAIAPLRDGEGHKQLRAVFYQFADDMNMDPALRYYFLHRTTYGGLPARIHQGSVHCSNPAGWDIVQTDRLLRAGTLLRDVKITVGDYLEVLQAPGKDVWVFADPPYYVNNQRPRGWQLYRDVFSEEQHVQLAEQIRLCPHRVLVSYDGDEPLIRELYCRPGFHVFTEDVVYVLRSGRKRAATELFITNYDRDYS